MARSRSSFELTSAIATASTLAREEKKKAGAPASAELPHYDEMALVSFQLPEGPGGAAQGGAGQAGLPPPALPAVPAVPAAPARRAGPAIPAAAAIPATPAIPAGPAIPAAAAIPATPAIPAGPAEAGGGDADAGTGAEAGDVEVEVDERAGGAPGTDREAVASRGDGPEAVTKRHTPAIPPPPPSATTTGDDSSDEKRRPPRLPDLSNVVSPVVRCERIVEWIAEATGGSGVFIADADGLPVAGDIKGAEAIIGASGLVASSIATLLQALPGEPSPLFEIHIGEGPYFQLIGFQAANGTYVVGLWREAALSPRQAHAIRLACRHAFGESLGGTTTGGRA